MRTRIHFARAILQAVPNASEQVGIGGTHLETALKTIFLHRQALRHNGLSRHVAPWPSAERAVGMSVESTVALEKTPELSL